MSRESHCMPGALPLLRFVMMFRRLSGLNCIFGKLLLLCLVMRGVLVLHCMFSDGGCRLWGIWMFLSST